MLSSFSVMVFFIKSIFLMSSGDNIFICCCCLWSFGFPYFVFRFGPGDLEDILHYLLIDIFRVPQSHKTNISLKSF